MNKIEVGEFVRTKTGLIFIITSYDEMQNKYYSVIKNVWNIIFPDDILKHSKNILDLIEENDIVEVLDSWTGNKEIIYIYDDRDISELKLDIKNGFSKLLSITTAEQFNQVKYEV